MRVLVAVLLAGALVGGCSRDAAETSSRPPPSAPPGVPPVVEASPVTAVAPAPVGDRVLSRSRLPGDPDFLAASGGLLWVKHADGKLLGLDPSTAAVRRRVDVARNAEGLNGSCNGLGGDDGHLWTCAGSGVALVTPTTTRAVPLDGVAKIFDQTSLPVQDGRVWVIEPDGTTVVGLRVGDGGEPVRLPLGVRCVDVAAGAAGLLWFACPTDGVGLRLDIATGEVVQVQGLRAARTVVAGEDVFFGYRAGLARVDQQSAQVTGAVAVAGADLHVSPDAVWVRGGEAFLRKVDPRSLALLEQLDAPETSDGSVLLAYGALWTTAFDDAVLYRLRTQR